MYVCMYGLFMYVRKYAYVFSSACMSLINVCMTGDSGYNRAVLSAGVLCERIGHPMGILRHFRSQGSLCTRGEMRYYCV